MKSGTLCGLIVLAAVLALPASVAALTIEVTSRSDNELGLYSDDYTKVNQADCLSDVGYNFAIDDEGADKTGREYYAFVGSSCDSDQSGC